MLGLDVEHVDAIGESGGILAVGAVVVAVHAQPAPARERPRPARHEVRPFELQVGRAVAFDGGAVNVALERYRAARLAADIHPESNLVLHHLVGHARCG